MLPVTYNLGIIVFLLESILPTDHCEYGRSNAGSERPLRTPTQLMAIVVTARMSYFMDFKKMADLLFPVCYT